MKLHFMTVAADPNELQELKDVYKRQHLYRSSKSENALKNIKHFLLTLLLQMNFIILKYSFSV